MFNKFWRISSTLVAMLLITVGIGVILDTLVKIITDKPLANDAIIAVPLLFLALTCYPVYVLRKTRFFNLDMLEKNGRLKTMAQFFTLPGLVITLSPFIVLVALAYLLFSHLPILYVITLND